MSDQPVPDPVAPVPETAPAQPAAEEKPWKHPGAQDYVPTGVPMSPDVKINGKRTANSKDWMRDQHKSPGYYPVFHEDVPQLDKTALMPVQPPSKIVLRAINRLGLPKKNWDRAKLMAVQELSKYMTMKITARVLLVRNINTLEQADMAMEWAQGILTSNSKEITTEQKLAAMQMMTLAMKSIKDLNAQQMELAEKGQDKISTERPRNLPPAVAVQVNIPGASSPSAPGNPAISVTQTPGASSEQE